VVDRVDVPVITQDVGKELGVDWHTAEKRLQKLIEKNRIKRTTVSGWHLHTAACSR
jgi:predicted transcriptional regulator